MTEIPASEQPKTPYDADIAHLATRTIEPDGQFGRQLQVLRAKQEGYRVGVADTEAHRDDEWQDGYDHGQGHEQAAAEELVAAGQEVWNFANGVEGSVLGSRWPKAVAAYEGRKDATTSN